MRHAVTGLGRPLDMSYPSNRLAAFGSALAGITAASVEWAESGAVDPIVAVMVTLSVFLAWAIARELDPDRPNTAALAMVFAFLLALIVAPGPGVAAAALIALRMVAGTVGLSLRSVDYLVVVGVGGYAGTRPEAWPIVGVLVLGVMVLRPRGAVALAIAAVAAGTVTAVVFEVIPNPGLSIGSMAVSLVAALTTLAVVPVREVSSACDSPGAVLTPRRITMTRIATAVAVVAGLALSPGSLGAFAPMLAATMATAAWSLVGDRQRGADDPSAEMVSA